MVTRKFVITAVVAFIAGIVVYYIFFVDLYSTSNEQSTKSIATQPGCPGEKYIYDMGFTWTEAFWEQNPNATDAEWTQAWNSMLGKIGCFDYQVTNDDVHHSSLLSDLIYATSTGQATCPKEDEVPGVFEHWYNYYMRGSATSTDEGAIQGWNELMTRNGCTETLDPTI